MKNFSDKEFIAKIKTMPKNGIYPKCPICGSDNYVVPDSFATVIIGSNPNALEIGKSIPSGIVICKKCGHIDLFALGMLGYFKKEDK